MSTLLWHVSCSAKLNICCLYGNALVLTNFSAAGLWGQIRALVYSCICKWLLPCSNRSDAVKATVAARQKPPAPVPAAGSKLPATAATSPDPLTSNQPLSKSQIKNKRRREKKRQDAELAAACAAAQHDVAAQGAEQQDGEAAASASDEPALASAGMQPAQVSSQHFLPFLLIHSVCKCVLIH